MKIIRKGTLPVILSGTCANCGCIVQCTTSEAREVPGQVYTHVVECPTPGCPNNIPLCEGSCLIHGVTNGSHS